MTGSEEVKVFREKIFGQKIYLMMKLQRIGRRRGRRKRRGEIELAVMMVVVTGPVPDVQCLVFSPVSIEVPKSCY